MGGMTDRVNTRLVMYTNEMDRRNLLQKLEQLFAWGHKLDQLFVHICLQPGCLTSISAVVPSIFLCLLNGVLFLNACFALVLDVLC